jgi:hypothetical protein
MSYLSLFTFFMIILVTADNLVQLFIGWEGKQNMPEIIIYLIFYLLGLILLPIKTPNLFNLVKRYFFSLRSIIFKTNRPS